MAETPVSVAVAAAGGLAYFLSPCVWPLYPAYLSYLGGAAGDRSRGALLVRAAGFVVGFSLVFVVLGATASALGQLLLAYQPLIRRVAGILIAAAGAVMLGWLRIPALQAERRPLPLVPRTGLGGALLMGIAFGFGWTPCVGPVLAAILTFAGTQATVVQGVILLSAFAAGLGLPFLVVAVMFDRLKARWSAWSRRLGLVTSISGVLLVVLGVMVYTNYLSMVSAWLYYGLQ
ncbi:MAG: cytochrome c biogenesis protein CcdA [Thermaerobacter sp.]|nr:cytochrome c biogenesis protein CcdA [Bacillota bacterium]